MKRLQIFLMGIICLASVQVFAQKLVPYTFRFEHQADSLKELELKVLTQVTYASTASLRLYLKGTQLGEHSYLLLEGTDGAKQELRRQDLENWQFSSAYFNGNAVKVSLIEAAGEKNRVHISEIKISDTQGDRKNTARISSESLQSTMQSAATTSASVTETYPYSKAVGRFTDGTHSYGTGWIAPNGAIVTSHSIYGNVLRDNGFDIIEFNIPLSDGTTVKHPSPQDQYPLGSLYSQAVNDNSLLSFKDGDDVFISGWAIIEVLPNSTGLRPGERQQEYFRIATNPSNSIIDAMGNIPVDIFHYGQLPGDSYTGMFRALHLTQTSLLKQNTYLSVFTSNRDNFVLYNASSILGFNPDRTLGSDGGAPITYQGSNVAIGVHEYSLSTLPSYGTGFRSDGFRNSLKNFFSAKSVYVDSEGLYDPATGEIHKPYLTVWTAVNEAPDGAQVYIAKGTYYAPLTINRPMTLRAPIGKVVLGAPNPYARTAAGPVIPRELLMDAPVGFDDSEEELESVNSFASYPNPFQDQTTVKYHLPDKSHVSVRVYNSTGAEIVILTNAMKEAGAHTVEWNGKDTQGREVPPGMYIVQLIKGGKTAVYKLIKK